MMHGFFSRWRLLLSVVVMLLLLLLWVLLWAYCTTF